MMWISIAPPIIVFILGFLTRRIALSLFIGIVAAALIATGGGLYASFLLIFNSLWNNLSIGHLLYPSTFTQASNFFILTFVLSLGVIIEIIRESHAATAFVDCVESSIKSKKGVETSAILLSHCLSIDDYLSSLTVGSVMRPLTDRFRIPRVKLAFLTDSMAAPLSMVTPVSSWAAAIIGFLTENGVSRIRESDTLLVANPYSLYLEILPYIFYSISLILSVWFIVRFGISYGEMQEHEAIAEESGNVARGRLTGDFPSVGGGDHSATLVDFLIPTGSLLLSTLLFLLYQGNSWIFGGGHTFVEALQSAPISLVLFSSGATTLLITATYFLARGRFSPRRLGAVALQGVRLMLPVAAILLFAWMMGDLLRGELKTGQWLATLFAGAIPVSLIPLILFWNATLISLALGSSWATTAILLPIALPMVMAMVGVDAPCAVEELPIILPVFGAILSGAVCGDHISLISETTIMATTSAGCDHMDHVRTQLVYSLPAFIGASVAFLVSGFLFRAGNGVMLFCCIAIALGITVTLQTLLHLRAGRRSSPATIQ